MGCAASSLPGAESPSSAHIKVTTATAADAVLNEKTVTTPSNKEGQITHKKSLTTTLNIVPTTPRASASNIEVYAENTASVMSSRRINKIEHYMPPWTYSINQDIVLSVHEKDLLGRLIGLIDVGKVSNNFTFFTTANYSQDKILSKNFVEGINIIVRKYFIVNNYSGQRKLLSDVLFREETKVLFSYANSHLESHYIVCDCYMKAISEYIRADESYYNVFKKVISVLCQTAIEGEV